MMRYLDTTFVLATIFDLNDKETQIQFFELTEESVATEVTFGWH